MKKKVLIQDDQSDFFFLLSTILEKEGWEAFEATNTEQCLKKVGEVYPDVVVIIDPGMPGTDELEVIEKMRERGCDAPVVIIITDMVDEYLPMLYLKKGVFDFLAMPINYAEFVFSVEQAFRHKKLLDSLRECRRESVILSHLRRDLENLARSTETGVPV